MKLSFIKDIKKSGKPCKPYQRNIKYVDTGNLIEGKIQGYQEFSFDEKPSRANVMVEIGDVIFAKMQNSLKVIEITEKEKEFVYSTGFYSFKDKRILPGFLKHYFISKQFNQLKDKLSNGATMKAINDSGMEQISIDVPTIHEQQSIVVTLDKINELIDANNRQLKLLDEAVKARFNEMFGDPITNKNNLPTKKYGDLFLLNAGGTPSTSNASYWENGNISWIGSNLCQNCILHNNDGKFITKLGLDNSSARVFLEDTVLIALVGATIGKTALLKFSTATNQNVLGIQNISKTGFNPYYVFFHTQFLYNKFLEIGDGGFNMATKAFVHKLPILMADPTSQNLFANFVKNVEDLKTNVLISENTLRELLNKKTDEYFGGNANA
jgi:type I restriction enzyme S subunit